MNASLTDQNFQFKQIFSGDEASPVPLERNKSSTEKMVYQYHNADLANMMKDEDLSSMFQMRCEQDYKNAKAHQFSFKEEKSDEDLTHNSQEEHMERIMID
jgi:hypothetical protein